jgi:ferritin-like metal-binding protein YciE
MPEMTNPRDLFLAELRDVLFVEQTLAKALPKLAQEASDDELREAFERHLEETRQHVTNIESAFERMGEKPESEPCAGIEGIKAEHDAFMESEDTTPEICDLFLTGAAGRAEHYEIAAYTGLLTMARALGEKKAAALIQRNLREEKEALRKVDTISRRLARDSAEERARARAAA